MNQFVECSLSRNRKAYGLFSRARKATLQTVALFKEVVSSNLTTQPNPITIQQTTHKETHHEVIRQYFEASRSWTINRNR